MKLDNTRISILVIDDADIIRNALRKFLMDYDLEVITCNDGLEGLQSALEYKPKLIFLDLMMPNLDGIRLLRVLKVIDDLKDIPVIIISGHTDKTNVMAAMEAGAEKIISKPLTKDVLVKSINEILGNKFLSSTKKIAQLSNSEKEKMTEVLRQYFGNSIANKRDSIHNSLNKKNKDLLKLILHELKGSSGTVGFPQISEMCKEVETVLTANSVDWEEINFKCGALLNKLIEIELSLKTGA